MSRVWLITGSSPGLGREIAEAALAAGNQVVATARDAAALRDLVDTYPDQVRAVSLDVTDRAEQTKFSARPLTLSVALTSW
jgi:NADP-dependent 3-hydroxy acid dehydrogenase YdfG